MKKPPIVEVVCGVVFAPVGEIDAVSLGGYWLRQRDRYPRKEIKPIVVDDAPGVIFAPGVPPSRVWLVSDNEAFIIQAQFDRFYFNWRRREDDYPRFNDRDGKEGVLTQALKEFATFKEFCEKELKVPIRERIVVLTKVDVFIEGEHWTDTDDLGLLIPWAKGLLSLSSGPSPLPVLRLEDRRPNNTLFRTELVTSLAFGPQGPVRLVKLETRVDRTLGAGDNELRRAFEQSNDELNHVFGVIVPQDERKKRFGEENGHVA